MIKINREEMKLITTFDLCRDLDDVDLNVLQEHLYVASYAVGEMLFTQGSRENDHLFIILKGQVKIIAALNQSGQSMVINSQHPGDVAGILSFIDGRVHNASAEVTAPTTVAMLSRQHYEQCRESHSDLATKLLQYLIVSADDMACQLMNKLARSQLYINESISPATQWTELP